MRRSLVSFRHADDVAGVEHEALFLRLLVGGGGVDGGLDGVVALALLVGESGLPSWLTSWEMAKPLTKKSSRSRTLRFLTAPWRVELVVFDALGADVALAVLFGFGVVGESAGLELLDRRQAVFSPWAGRAARL